MDALTEHLERRYGLRGELFPLGGERDRNFRMAVNGRSLFVVKIAHPAEQPAVIEAQALAANHARNFDPTLPVQSVALTTDGQPTSVIAHAGEARIVRVVEWLPGQVMATAALTSSLASSVGSTLARLGRALHTYTNPYASQDLLWDLSKAARLAEMLPQLAADPLYGPVEEALRSYNKLFPGAQCLAETGHPRRLQPTQPTGGC
jgi:Ser/Thr protein kinase RdoA (MazF antagonist)